ncbi:uncharacterized protein M6B38_304535 [Iris pallida]|uniref:Uncharacterized protein n=2 Tax=Iris pallida TaxID=29817 RepID=A0AAX6HLD2_IRIPA|nr:uncharacterized protein M6B38_304535 [Iris pallida]
MLQTSPEHIMQQRRSSPAGRPSGTDGSDFSYRMVVDSRYTKVAKGKSHLKALFALQTVSQVIGSLLLWVSASQGPELNRFAVLSVSIGFISLIIGHIGQRRSQVNLLRAYTFISCIATAFSIARMVRNDVLLKVIHYKNVEALTNYELLKVVHLLFGVVLQIFVFIIVPSLVRNMSPPKRSQ